MQLGFAMFPTLYTAFVVHIMYKFVCIISWFIVQSRNNVLWAFVAYLSYACTHEVAV